MSNHERQWPVLRFQPVDKSRPFDKRYEGSIVPAVKAAELQSYQLDRDMNAVIPIGQEQAKQQMWTCFLGIRQSTLALELAVTP